MPRHCHALPGLTVDPRPEPIVTAGSHWRPDITVAELRLVVEYDGAFFHRGRDEHDARKSAALRRAGWTVVRLREEPLQPTHAHDLPVPERPPAAADGLLARLLPHLHTVLPAAQRHLLERSLARAATAGAPPWQWREPPAHFGTALTLLAQFAEREGHACPPSEHREDGFSLGRWVMRQRRLHRAGKLPQAQVDLLTGQHGWVWDWHADWALFEDALRSFVAREGHARVGHAHVEAGYQLGQKAATLRGQYRRGQLDPQRVAMLEQLTGWTWAPRHGRSGTSVGRFRVSEGKGQLPAPRIADGHHT